MEAAVTGPPPEDASVQAHPEERHAPGRWALALAPVAVACALQSVFWAAIQPFSWFLFYPAVFVSSWIGGLRPGLVATALATAVVWYAFIPVQWSLFKDHPRYYASAITFAVMGAAFACFHERLRAAQAADRVANQRLQAANDEITRLYERTRELDTLRTQFFAGVSHELRTPLTLILGPVEHLRARADLPGPAQRDLDVVARNARIVLRHVNDLLDVARIDSGQLVPRHAAVDIAQAVRTVAGHFDSLALERSVALTVDVPATLTTCCDRQLMDRVLFNLLSNAFKFTPGGGRVRVSAAARGERLELVVADSGPGIPADKRDAVFERFRQLDAGADRRHPGTGLGLTIVRELVRLHGGTVSVDDAPEGGALFRVDLPLRAPAEAPAPDEPASRSWIARQVADELAAPKPAAAAAGGPEAGSAGLVVLAEDNADMRAFVVDALSPRFDVRAAENGERALALALELLPDLVLTDVMMPQGSGEELVRKIREHRSLDGVPIIVLTARADEDMRMRLLRQGAQDYLTKPFMIEELRLRAGNLVARRRAEVEGRRLAGQVDAVTRASMAVSDAVATLPHASAESVLQAIAMQAQILTGAELTAVGIGGDREHPFSTWVQVGFPLQMAARIGRPPRPVGILAVVATESQVVRIADLRSHPAFAGLPEGHPPIRSLLGVPVRFRGRTVGNLYLANKRGNETFSDSDQRIVEMMAARVAAAIETAHLYTSLGLEHAWLVSVIQTMPEPVILVDGPDRRTVFNAAALALAGIPPGARDGSTSGPHIDLRTVDGEPIEWHLTPIGRALESAQTVPEFEGVVYRPDGSRVPVMVSAAPVACESASARTGAVAVFRDISLAKELQRLREDWMAVVAHDLRQPISVIALTVDELADALPPTVPADDAAAYARLKSATSRLNRMVDDLLGVTQIEAGHLKIVPRPADLVALVREVVERAAPTLRGRPVRFRTALDRAGVVVDAGRIEQVLVNLLMNAAKYGDPGTGIEVEVDGRPGEVRVSVVNRGPGIPPAEMEHLFVRFYRAREARRGRAAGLGLGLFIVKGLVDAHGGRVQVASEPAGETRFSFTLPLAAT